MVLPASGFPQHIPRLIERPRYLAYMLRLREIKLNGEQTWRASLAEPHTGERHGFPSLEIVFDSLKEQTHAPPKGDASDVVLLCGYVGAQSTKK